MNTLNGINANQIPHTRNTMPLPLSTQGENRQRTTLVTGAGVIGCHTARLLAERGERVVLLDLSPAQDAIDTIVKHPLVSVVQCDVADFPALHEVVSANQVTHIVHTAALLSTAIRKDILAGVRVNIMGAMHVLEAARQLGVKRVVLASSTTVGYPAFGDFDGPFFPEDFPLKSIANRPGSIYAATKVTSEHLALLYRDLHGLSTVSLRYAAVISAWNGPGTSVPGRVLSSLVASARRGDTAFVDDPFMVWLGGDEFIDARDCALANVAALNAAAPTQGVYNIGMGRLSSFDDFVCAVRHLFPALEVQLNVQPSGGFAGFPHVRQAPSDISMAANELAWSPIYSLNESVAHFAPLLG